MRRKYAAGRGRAGSARKGPGDSCRSHRRIGPQDSATPTSAHFKPVQPQSLHRRMQSTCRQSEGHSVAHVSHAWPQDVGRLWQTSPRGGDDEPRRPQKGVSVILGPPPLGLIVSRCPINTPPLPLIFLLEKSNHSRISLSPFQPTKHSKMANYFSVTGVRDGINGEIVPIRQEIRTLQSSNPDMFNLYLLGMRRMQSLPKTDKLSWFQISGIHGRPYAPWDGVKGVGNAAGYCTHSSILFLTWHRPYLALFEASNTPPDSW